MSLLRKEHFAELGNARQKGINLIKNHMQSRSKEMRKYYKNWNFMKKRRKLDAKLHSAALHSWYERYSESPKKCRFRGKII